MTIEKLKKAVSELKKDNINIPKFEEIIQELRTNVLQEKPFIFEEVDEDGNYRKSSCREIEQVGFYIRIFHEQFIPCKQCQLELQKIIRNADSWTIGNKDTEPAIELWRKFEIDDNAWKEIEKRKATLEDKKRFKDKIGITTYT